MGSKLPGPGLSDVLFSATPTRYGFYALYLITYGLIKGGVGHVDDAVRTGVWVVVAVLVAVYARLFCVHSVSPSFVGRASGACNSAGPFLYLSIYLSIYLYDIIRH